MKRFRIWLLLLLLGSTSGVWAQSRPFILVIDPAHGGSEEGYIASNGQPESEITLYFGLMVQEAAQRRGLQVRMIRDTDTLIKLSERVDMYYGEWVDLYLSLHLGEATRKRREGARCYVSLENAAMTTSLGFAQSITQSIYNETQAKILPIEERSFWITDENHYPTVVFEMGTTEEWKDLDVTAPHPVMQAMAEFLAEGLYTHWQQSLEK